MNKVSAYLFGAAMLAAEFCVAAWLVLVVANAQSALKSGRADSLCGAVAVAAKTPIW